MYSPLTPTLCPRGEGAFLFPWGKANSSADPDQDVVLAHPLARRDVDSADHAGAWGADLVLHLHGFQDEQALARAHLLTRLDQHRDDNPGHGADNIHLALCLSSGLTLAGPPGAFVLDLYSVALPAQGHEADVLTALDKDLVRLGTHEERVVESAVNAVQVDINR